MGVAIVVSAILTLYALMVWRASSEFHVIGYHKMEIASVFVGSVLFGIAEVWTLSELMKIPQEPGNADKYVLASLFVVGYAVLTIWRAINYRTIWKKVAVILISAIAITIGYLA